MKIIHFNDKEYAISSNTIYGLLMHYLGVRGIILNLEFTDDGFGLRNNCSLETQFSVIAELVNGLNMIMQDLVVSAPEVMKEKWNSGIGHDISLKGGLPKFFATQGNYEKAISVDEQFLEGLVGFLEIMMSEQKVEETPKTF